MVVLACEEIYVGERGLSFFFADGGSLSLLLLLLLLG
jgi:hypothetical protein